MFTDETERRDWIFGIVVTAVIIGGLYWIRSQPIEQRETTPVAVEPPAPRYQSVPAPEAPAYQERIIITGKSSPQTIGRVYECERGGQRVLSDRPCGADAMVREIAAPNRMQSQDTSVLYEPLPRSIQVQKMRAAGQRTGSNVAVCARIDEAKDRINARMRRPYTHQEGEYYRERLRKLSDQRWDAGCGK